MAALERLQADYKTVGTNTGAHPMALIRDRLPDLWTAAELRTVKDGTLVRIGGEAICRQRPGTARGVVFVSLEDETGISNAIVPPDLFEAERWKITLEPFLTIDGVAQHRNGTIHIEAKRVEQLPFAELSAPPSHNFH